MCKITKSIIYIFKNKKLAVIIPGSEIIVEKHEKNVKLKEILSKSISANFRNEELIEAEEKIESVREYLRQEEDSSFVYITTIESNRDIVDIKTIDLINKNNKNFINLVDNEYEIINIDQFLEKIKTSLVKRNSEHIILEIDSSNYDIRKFLLMVKNKNMKNLVNNKNNIDEIIKLFMKERADLFIKLSLDIFNEIFVSKFITAGNYNKFLGPCDYKKFDDFGIHLEKRGDVIVISMADFDGTNIHLEDLNEVRDFKYIAMNYVDSFII